MSGSTRVNYKDMEINNRADYDKAAEACKASKRPIQKRLQNDYKEHIFSIETRDFVKEDTDEGKKTREQILKWNLGASSRPATRLFVSPGQAAKLVTSPPTTAAPAPTTPTASTTNTGALVVEEDTGAKNSLLAAIQAAIAAINASSSNTWTADGNAWKNDSAKLKLSVENDKQIKFEPVATDLPKTHENFKKYFIAMFEVMAKSGKVYQVSEDAIKTMVEGLAKSADGTDDEAKKKMVLAGLKSAMSEKDASGSVHFETCFNEVTRKAFGDAVNPPKTSTPILTGNPPVKDVGLTEAGQGATPP